MMVFEIRSRLDVEVRLGEAQWLHIRSRHEEMESQQEKMILTLEDPSVVYYSPRDEVYYYYRHFEETPVTEKYLLLVVKHLNSEGFIITSFFVSRIRTRGKEVVYEQEDFYQL